MSACESGQGMEEALEGAVSSRWISKAVTAGQRSGRGPKTWRLRNGWGVIVGGQKGLERNAEGGLGGLPRAAPPSARDTSRGPTDGEQPTHRTAQH